MRYKILSFANGDTLFLYLYVFILFLLHSCLVALARTMLNRHWESGHPFLILDFRGNGFSFSPLSMMLGIGLSCIAFIRLRYIPSIPSFLRAFTQSGVESYHGLFLHLLR
jgi:hypothetical protein